MITQTLETLKDYWQQLALSYEYNDVKVLTFKIGNYYDAANSGHDKYPLVFWEMPYSINMNLNKPLDTVQVSLSVFLSTKQDNEIDAHQVISKAKEIGDAIILRASAENKVTTTGFSVDAANSLSVREYSDDYVAGVRYDLTLTVVRDLCDVNLDDYFN